MVTIWASGEIVAGVTVTATGEDRPVTRATTTDVDGRFRIALLPPGRYAVAAGRAGYSTVTIVGVVVSPGEERQVELQVAETDEKESVTETINDTLRLEGVDAGWVLPVTESDLLPLFRGTANDVAGLFPRFMREQSSTGDLPLEAVGVASLVTTAGRTDVAGADAGRPFVVPRWGANDARGSLRFVWGERVSGRDDSPDGRRVIEDWARGVLTLGGANEEGDLTGFLSIDHVTEPVSRTAVTATIALESAPGRSFFFTANGFDEESPDDEPSVVSLESDFWSLRGRHAWQISSGVANALGLTVERRADDLVAEDDVAAWRRQSLNVEEQLAWLPSTKVRHELRGGVMLRLGIDDRLLLAGDDSSLERDLDEGATWIEDEIRLARLRLRAGIRVDWWTGAVESTEVSPRVGLAWTTRGETPTVLRASWDRFHQVASPFDLFDRATALEDPATAFAFEPTGPFRTDRTAFGISRDLSGLAAWSIDVVSSSFSNVPRLVTGGPSTDPQLVDDGEADLVEISLGARVDVFGKADAILSYTWSDLEKDEASPPCATRHGLPCSPPEHRASLAIRTDLPVGWVAAAIVRYSDGLASGDPGPAEGDVGNSSSTVVDVSLSKTFDVGGSTGRLAIEAYNLTGDTAESLEAGTNGATWRHENLRPTLDRSIALNLSYRFGY